MVLIGGGGHCRACLDVIETTEYEVAGIVDPSVSSMGAYNYPILGDDSFVAENIDKYRTYFLAIGQTGLPLTRIRVFEKLESLPINFASILSGLSYVSEKALVGDGSVVMHGAMINTGSRIGHHNIVNSKALIEHDVSTGDFCHFSTASVVNGGCEIGNNVFIGSGCIVFNNLTITDDVVVGGGSVVNKSILEPGKYVGSPARKVASWNGTDAGRIKE